ncbi:tetratricopeptide repeat-containing protein [Roseococcus sp.]|uniref:tetratricopeptide repeat-containing protein n=1 Tax=Roseococcus sp. TaxID=2109646 RepID=UPI003BA9148A
MSGGDHEDRLRPILDFEARGLLFSAHDAAMAALGEAPEDRGLAYHAVLALARSGATAPALALFHRLGLHGVADPEIAALEARLAKDSAFATTGPNRRGLLARACDLYLAVWRELRLGYHGVNAATLTLLLGDREGAAQLARDVAAAHRDQGDYWSAATLAEALLVAGETRPAVAALEIAAARPDGDAAMRATTRRQLRRVLAALDLSEDLLAILPAPLTLHFCGHLPGPDWDAGGEARLTASIATALDQERPGAAFGALAAGADILVAEALLRRGVRPTIVLPVSVEGFSARSVAPFGEGWVRRFEACLAASDVTLIDEPPFATDDLDLTLVSRRAMGLALLRARHIEGSALQLALWDGVPATGMAGTARDVAGWQAAGGRLRHLAWPWTRAAAAAPAAPSRPLKAVLFGDLPRFGLLDDAALAAFYGTPMAAMGAAIDAESPDYRNAWGDAVQVVFGDIAAAARCAFGLRAALTPAKLAAAGLPEALVPRLALDFGPLLPVCDAVQGVAKFAGRVMTRAARVEPVTPPGHVFATEAFACEVALRPGSGLACDYSGRIAAAKGFGILPLYALRREDDET